MEGRERGQIRRFIAFILSVFMVVGIVNVPGGVVNAESDEYYTITFDGNGFIDYQDYDSSSGGYVKVSSKSTCINKGESIEWYGGTYYERDGYKFLGFKINGSDTLYVIYDSYDYDLKEGEAFLSDYVPTGDTIFYAVGEEAYVVTYDANGGWYDNKWDSETEKEIPDYSSITKKKNILKGSQIKYDYVEPRDRDGYEFLGYKIEGSDTLYIDSYLNWRYRDYYYDHEYEVEIIDEYVPTEDVTFKAVWAEAYIVTYDGNGGWFDTDWDEDSHSYIPNYTPEKRKIIKGSNIDDEWENPRAREGYVCLGYKLEDSDTIYVTHSKYDYELEDWEEFLSDYVPTEDVTFKAQWEEAYVVTFDGNGGWYDTDWDYETGEEIPDYSPQKINVKKGSDLHDYYIRKPYDRKGYVFLGYKIDGSDTLYITDNSYKKYNSEYAGKIENLEDYVPTEDVTFKAVWEEAYVVTYDGNGGWYDNKWDSETEKEIPDYSPVEINILEGYSIINDYPYIYSRPGYAFIGYKTEGSDLLYVTKDKDDYELEEGEAFLSDYVPTEDVTFYAEWADTYQITYDGNGGWYSTEWDEESQKYIPDYTPEKYQIRENSKIGSSRPYRPCDREGYVFTGYKLEGDNTLYVTYDSDNYELKSGEAFLSEYVATGNITFYAQWEKANVVTFDGNGGYYDTKWDAETDDWIPDYSPVKDTIRKGSALEYYEHTPYERYGYNFIGYKIKGSDTLYVNKYRGYYDLKEGEAFLNEYVPTGDVTFYAQWEEARILDIKLDSSEGYFFSEETGEKDYDVHDIKDYYPIYNGYQPGQKISIGVECRKEGMVFDGWKSGVDGTVYKPGDTVTFTDDDTFTAQYKDGNVVVLNPNGGYYYEPNWYYGKYYGEPWLVASEDGKISIDMMFGTDEEGMALAGWKRDGDETLYSNEDLENMTFTDDETFTAQWSEGYKVTFYSEEGYMQGYSAKRRTANVYVAKGSKFYGMLPITSADAQTREGYYVEYWTLDGDDTTEYHDADIQNMIIDRDMTFTAHWKEAPVITYKANGGYVSNNSGTLYKDEFREFRGVGAKLPERRTYRDGYDQTGWLVEDESPLNGSIITDLTTYVVGGDATFIAQWKIKNPDGKCAVKFDYDGATIVYNGEEYAGSDYESETYFEQGKKLNTDQLYGETWFDSVVKDNYILKGWMVVGAEDETIYDNPRDIVCDSDMTVKAVFIQDCSKLGHEEEEVAAVEPTCTEKGHKAGKRCSVCGETLEGLEEIPALKHNYVEVENTAVEPTCTKAGKEADKKCSRCEDVIIGKTIKATGHNMTAHSAVTATCETEGNSAYWSCDKCDKFFSDKDGKNEIDENSWIIPAAGHKYGKLIAESPAKCTEDGVKAHYECSVCKKLFVYEGDDYTETTEAALKIAAPGHEEEEVSELDPTCDIAGHKAGKKCSVCGEALEGMEVIPALGHEWDEGEVTTEPTCSKLGVRTYHCTREGCNKTKTETIAKKAHTIVIDPAVEATTEKTGLTEGSHCSVCKTIIKRQQVIPKKEDPNKKAEEEAKKKAEEEAKKKAEEEAKKKAEEEAKKKAAENAKTGYSDEWVDGKWYDANGKQSYSGTLLWKSDATGWWVEDTDGWYPKDSWQKIDGIWYYFKPNGYMAMGEYYYGYWFNKDGSWDPAYKLSWKSNETGWWVEDISGWWPSNTWLKIDGNWYYFNGSGYMVTNQYVDGWWIGSDGVCR